MSDLKDLVLHSDKDLELSLVPVDEVYELPCEDEQRLRVDHAGVMDLRHREHLVVLQQLKLSGGRTGDTD